MSHRCCPAGAANRNDVPSMLREQHRCPIVVAPPVRGTASLCHRCCSWPPTPSQQPHQTHQSLQPHHPPTPRRRPGPPPRAAAPRRRAVPPCRPAPRRRAAPRRAAVPPPRAVRPARPSVPPRAVRPGCLLASPAHGAPPVPLRAPSSNPGGAIFPHRRCGALTSGFVECLGHFWDFRSLTVVDCGVQWCAVGSENALLST